MIGNAEQMGTICGQREQIMCPEETGPSSESIAAIYEAICGRERRLCPRGLMGCRKAILERGELFGRSPNMSIRSRSPRRRSPARNVESHRSHGGFGLVRGQTADELRGNPMGRSEEHTSELQSLMRISYAVFCLKK